MKKTILLITFLSLLIVLPSQTMAAGLGDKLKGKILLQVEDKGQAWYVDPSDGQRAFLGRPADAFRIMREFGLGVSEEDYANFSAYMPDKLIGKILLRVELNGEAYYVDPASQEPKFLGRPADAFALMRELGLGISNDNLNKIDIFPGYEEIDYGSQSKEEGNDQSEQEDTGEGEDSPEVTSGEPLISNLVVSDIGTDQANISFEIDQMVEADLVYGQSSGDYRQSLELSVFRDGDIYRVDQVLANLVPEKEYTFKIKMLDPEGGEFYSDDVYFATKRVLLDLALGEVQRIRTVTVSDSYPQVYAAGNDSALMWFDGFNAFSMFDQNDLELKQLHDFVANNKGDLTYNGQYYGLAWERSCRVNVNVVSNLNGTLSNDETVSVRNGEGCPINIGLSSDGEDFGLTWTGEGVDGQDKMYFKVFDRKANSLYTEVTVSEKALVSLRPALIWSGEYYVLVWAEMNGDKYQLKAVRMDPQGSQYGEPETVAESDEIFGGFDLSMSNDGLLQIVWGQKNSIAMTRFDFDSDPADIEVFEYYVETSLDDDSVLKVQKRGDDLGLAWLASDGVLRFVELDPEYKANSLVSTISGKNSEITYFDLYLNGGSYGVFWHANSDMVKAVYHRKID